MFSSRTAGQTSLEDEVSPPQQVHGPLQHMRISFNPLATTDKAADTWTDVTD